ncbi:hypothetical protein V8E36_006917, partial [Tilletia maclaganii]
LQRELNAARNVQDFRSGRTLEESGLPDHDQIKALRRSIIQHLPITQGLVAALIGQDADLDRHEESDSDSTSSEELQSVDEGIAEGHDPDGSASRHDSRFLCAQVVIVSLLLMARSQKMNRLQALIGCIIRFSHAPRSVQTFLNHLSLSTSRGTSSRHLADLGARAKARAVEIMEDQARVKVMVFDNIDIYLRVRPERLTASSHLINLTSRTFFRLPCSFQAAAVSQERLRPLHGTRKLTIQDVAGDPEFLRRAAKLQISKELLHNSSTSWRSRSTKALLDKVVRQLQSAHVVDALPSTDWESAPLPLLEENEGSVRGTIAVLQQTAEDLGLVGISSPSTTPVQGSSSAHRFRTSLLPADASFIVAGDLKSHRNVAAALEARSEYENDAERLSWYHSVFGPWHLHLNWVWTIFKSHFSSSKAGYEACLERLRDALRRGKTALREDKPSYNEAWLLIQQTFSGWISQLAHSVLDQQKKDVKTWSPRDESAVLEVIDAIWLEGFHASSVRLASSSGASARLFLRDALLGLEWEDACRRGDIGRIRQATHFFALGFAGAGRHQYASACLDDLWAARVLEPQTWKTLAAARFFNRHGGPQSFVPADLYQEHLNKELQRVDTAHGVTTAVDRLRDMFSSTAEVARSVRQSHARLLGEPGLRRHKTKHHKDIERIQQLAASDRLLEATSETAGTGGPTAGAESQGDIQRHPQRAQELLRGHLSPLPAADVLSAGYITLSKSGLQRWMDHTSASERYEALIIEELGEEGLIGDEDEAAEGLRHRDWHRRQEELDFDVHGEEGESLPAEHQMEPN